jgi:8-oxo-dGTP pyrophosphatase MutT (NUDIX family)
MKPIEVELKHKAGVIPYTVEDGVLKMFFMKPSNAKFGGSQFQIAKGNIDPGESPDQAALREGVEELGLKLLNVMSLKKLTTQRITGLDETYMISVYAAKVRDPSNFSNPHYETKEVAWMTLDEYRATGRLNQLPIVQMLEPT